MYPFSSHAKWYTRVVVLTAAAVIGVAGTNYACSRFRTAKLNDQLVEATSAGDNKAVSQLLSLGADPNARSAPPYLEADTIRARHGRYTALQIAITSRHLETTMLLLHAGANPLLLAADGRTALDFAKMVRDRRLIDVVAGNASRDLAQMKTNESTFLNRTGRSDAPSAH